MIKSDNFSLESETEDNINLFDDKSEQRSYFCVSGCSKQIINKLFDFYRKYCSHRKQVPRRGIRTIEIL